MFKPLITEFETGKKYKLYGYMGGHFGNIVLDTIIEPTLTQGAMYTGKACLLCTGGCEMASENITGRVYMYEHGKIVYYEDLNLVAFADFNPEHTPGTFAMPTQVSEFLHAKSLISAYCGAAGRKYS
jgi:hypothetical protein